MMSGKRCGRRGGGPRVRSGASESLGRSRSRKLPSRSRATRPRPLVTTAVGRTNIYACSTIPGSHAVERDDCSSPCATDRLYSFHNVRGTLHACTIGGVSCLRFIFYMVRVAFATERRATRQLFAFRTTSWSVTFTQLTH